MKKSMNGEPKKIVLIGPVYPYKGGISHYTGLMYRALASVHDVSMVSYSFQYPKILYKKEQKDYSNDTFKPDKVEYLINTANPFNWLKSATRISRLNPDLVIVQWWHPYFAPCYQSIIKRIKRKSSAKVMFICHNVFPHERFPLDRALTKRTLKKGDYFIVQSGQDENDLLGILPDARYKRAVHPTYNAFKMQNMSKEEARKILGIQDKEKVLLFFGFVRKYKGLDYLIKAMPTIKEKLPDCKLLVVGDFGDNKDEYMSLIDEYDVRNAIDIHDGYIPDKEVEKFFAACDVVVLPYVSATQSGIAQIAYGFDKPVIATNVGGLPDVVIDDKTGYLVEKENPQALAYAVIRYFNGNMEARFEEGVKEESEKYSWDRMVEHIDLFGVDLA